MMNRSNIARAVAASAFAAALMAAAPSFAGDCPAGKEGKDVTPPGPSAPVGVTDTVIATNDLTPYGFPDHVMRMRRLVIQPGGIVPWHSHSTRPANIYVVSGSITEYRSTCALPIEHPAGDVTAEHGDLSHWWKNNTSKPTVLISADEVPQKMMSAGGM